MLAPDFGAGTLVHVGRYDLAEFAVVLEPEEPLRTARRALYAGLTALAEALAVQAPPEKPINFDLAGCDSDRWRTGWRRAACVARRQR